MPRTEASSQSCIVCGIHTVWSPQSVGFAFPAYKGDNDGLCIEHAAEDVRRVGLQQWLANLRADGWVIVERNLVHVERLLKKGA